LTDPKFRVEYQIKKTDDWIIISWKDFDTIEQAEKFIHQELSSFATSARIIKCEIVREHKVLMA